MLIVRSLNYALYPYNIRAGKYWWWDLHHCLWWVWRKGLARKQGYLEEKH